MPEGAAAVLTFIKAFNEQDLESLSDVLHPEVVIHASRGPRHGIDEALSWARRVETGELVQRIELEHVEIEGQRALADIRRQWWWRNHDELAREDRMHWLFGFRDELIVSWRPIEDSGAAREAFAGGTA